MVSETIRKQIINLIWQGYNSFDIVKEFSPLGDRAERELFDAACAFRADIEKFVKEVPGLIELGLRNGFDSRQIFDTIDEQGEGLIPRWNLDNFIAAAQKRIEDENAPVIEAAEKAASEARRAAIQQRIDNARQALRDAGLPC